MSLFNQNLRIKRLSGGKRALRSRNESLDVLYSTDETKRKVLCSSRLSLEIYILIFLILGLSEVGDERVKASYYEIKDDHIVSSEMNVKALYAIVWGMLYNTTRCDFWSN